MIFGIHPKISGDIGVGRMVDLDFLVGEGRDFGLGWGNDGLIFIGERELVLGE